MNKAFHNFAWRNYPDDNTPLNESNLNKINNALDEVDDRVIALDNTKATKAEVAALVKEISFNETTGVFTITRKNNAIFTIDTKLEKIAVNFTYDPTTQQIILTLIDGTKQFIDLSALITQYEFLDSDTVNFQLQSDGKVTAIVKEGSIQEKHLRPDYLADIKAQSAKAEAGATAAAKSETNAKASETAAKMSEANAAASAAAATDKASEATDSATNAAASSTTAAQKAAAAKASAENAATSATRAAASFDTANAKAMEALESAATASAKAAQSSDYAKQSQSYAVGTGGVRPNESMDSAKYYYEQSKNIYDHFAGAENVVDSAMSDTSKNPVENRAIKNYIDAKSEVNLLVASNPNITTARYNMATFGFVEEPKNGERVTILLKGALGSDRTAFNPYMGNQTELTRLTSIGDGYYVSSFNWKQGTSVNRVLNIYQQPASGTSLSTIEWVKLVKGEVTSKEWSDGQPLKYGREAMQGAGWRRIAKYNARGGVGILSGSFTVTIGRNYSGNNNEIHQAQIVYTYGQIFKIINLLDQSNSQVITKLRVVYDANAQMNFLEMYYNTTGANLVYVNIENGVIPTDGCWVAITPELVADESALSIKAEAALPANFHVGGSEIDASAVKSGVLARERIPKVYKLLYLDEYPITDNQNMLTIPGTNLSQFRFLLINLEIQSVSGPRLDEWMPICFVLHDGYWNYQNIALIWKTPFPEVSTAITGIQAGYGDDSIAFYNVDGYGFSSAQLAEDTFLFSQKATFAEASSSGLRLEIQQIFGVY